MPGIEGLVARAAARARRLGLPVLVTHQARFGGQDSPVDLWNRFAPRSDRCFLWSSAWSGRQMVCAGSMRDIVGHGPDRFSQVDREWSALSRDPVGDGPTAPTLLGGFAFRPAPPNERSEILPDALLWLPSVQLSRDAPGEPWWLSLNAVVWPNADQEAIATEMAATGRRLLSPAAATRSARPRCRISLCEYPSARSWRWLVADAVNEIRQGSIEKVVLARRVEVRTDAAFDVGGMLRHLCSGSGETTVFASSVHGRCFLGATPEYLVRVNRDQVSTVGLAGSAPRGTTAAEDAEIERRLRASGKDTYEHQLVVDRLLDTLRQTCADAWTEPGPGVLKLAHVQHLCTRLGASLGERGLFELLARLHPTPALGGHPRGDALNWLADHEPLDRGWYAAPVGWVDARGQCEFAVAIRSALVSGGTASVYAGCGVVAGSDPEAEYRESEAKLRGMLSALGVP